MNERYTLNDGYMEHASDEGEWVHYSDYSKMRGEYQKQVHTLKSRLVSLEKDAARYRWLRNETAIVASNFTERIAIAHYEKDEHDCMTLDGHIDTAMQANKGE